MKTLNIFLLVLTLVLLIQSDSFSQWIADPNNPMAVCNEPLEQREPAMISDGSGGYFIFWVDLRNYGNEADIYGQRLDAAGNKLWAAAGKKIADSVYYSIPKAINTSDGNIIILYNTTNGGGKIWAKKINTAGNSIWSVPFFIAGWPQLGADIYNAVTDKSGGIIITYQVTWGGGSTFIFAQRVASNGTVKWLPASNGLNLSESGECRAPIITSDERGGAHIFYYNVPGPYNIWKTHIDSSGNFSPKEALYLTSNNYPLIRAVSDGSGGAVISWATNGFGASQSDIFAQRINLAGDEQWNATGNAVCNFNGVQTSHNLTRTSDGNYIIVWSDARSTVNNDVYCQKLNAAGNSLWTSNGVLVTNYTTYYPEPNLIGDNSGGAYIFVYNSQTNFSAARIKSDGTFYWTPNLRTLAASIYNPSYHRFIPAKNGDGAITVWQTSIGVGANGVGIYGSKINSDGTLSGSLILNLSVLIEGFYNTVSNTMISDTARVYLRNSTAPYNIVDSSKKMLSNSGAAPFLFSNALNGVNYYLAVKHRNSIETWSSSPVTFTSGSSSFNFTNNSAQAFGSNMKQVDSSPLKFAMFSGDKNQDGSVNLSDVIEVYNSASSFTNGYVSSDMNGDNIADLADVVITNNNSNNFVSVIKP